ncbi:MAG: hypothetical protein A3K19_12140 [Lentisphaerae bacterium RIFOXYB12_FULL_65_16]|nr:MAG: hypothetical protein A3K18_14535 [Lentisphaerae bacterium RIFOXYA12_64_32]OGV86226.1 MAG: hypothetical protein A3K19_12140 [Lentisphaerae bacterium RIFOXYB12_FULL_65_16]
MNLYNLPNTDLTVSGICLGAAPFGWYLEERDAFAQLDYFVASGGVFVDTAHSYGGKGTSERMVGNWMASRQNRRSIVLATKGGEDTGLKNYRTLHADEIAEDVEESLECLQTEYIDLYYLHIDDRTVPVAEIIDVLNAKAKEGKLRYIGCSNWGVDRIAAANAYAKKSGQMGFVANEIEWSLAVPNRPNTPDSTTWMDTAFLDYHRRTGMNVCAYSPQARGLFAKLEKLGAEGLNEGLRKTYLNSQNLETFERLKKLSAQTGDPVTVLTLAYICHQKKDFFTVPIVGCSSMAQLKECLAADACTLDPSMLECLAEGR